ncbi:MAG: MBL fold metallo-hydrolase [Phycisphaerae bacterium]|nr:MBL fold metallo-hydrolase [Phycisphaerae bacterium]MDW8261999.1 MBL fold metallo-hydrolase [Phycisphaerales bacterium]
MNWRSLADWAKHRPILLRLADRLGRGRGRWRPLDGLPRVPRRAPMVPDLGRFLSAQLSAVWIGHATVLLRVGGMTVLTDPVFSNRIGLDVGLLTLGPQRLIRPALSLEHLPRVDLILVSHAHFDHLDRPTLTRFDRATPVLTSQHNDDLIRDLGFRRVSALRPGDVQQVGRLKVTAWPVRHWGPRVFFDDHRGYCGFLLDSGQHRVLFGGDSADGEHFSALQNVDLAILGIAAYEPYHAAHATPEQAWGMFRRMGARWLLPMHHSTFSLSLEPPGEPLQRLLAAAGPAVDRIVIRQIGQTWAA